MQTRAELFIQDFENQISNLYSPSQEEAKSIFHEINEIYNLSTNELLEIVTNLIPVMDSKHKDKLEKAVVDEYLRDLFNSMDLTRFAKAAFYFKNSGHSRCRQRIINFISNKFQMLVKGSWDEWCQLNFDFVIELLSQHSLNVDHEDFVLKAMICYANANFAKIINIQDWNAISLEERNLRLQLFRHVYWNFLSNKEDALKHIAMFVHPYDIEVIISNVRTHQRRVKEDMQIMKKTSWKSTKYGSMQITMYTIGPKKVKKKNIEYTLSFNIKKRKRTPSQNFAMDSAMKRIKLTVPYKSQGTSSSFANTNPLPTKEYEPFIEDILSNSSKDVSFSESFIDSSALDSGFLSSLADDSAIDLAPFFM